MIDLSPGGYGSVPPPSHPRPHHNEAGTTNRVEDGRLEEGQPAAPVAQPTSGGGRGHVEEFESDTESASFIGWMTVLFFAHYLIGAIVYRIVEGWSIVDALYFCAVTMTTVGYGDLLPTSAAMQGFTVAYIWMSMGLISFAVGHVTAKAMEDREEELLGAAAAAIMDNETRQYFKITVSLTKIVLFLLSGAFFFSYFEGWTFLEGLYFCTVTITSVGYGDLTPSGEYIKMVCTLYVFIGVIMTSNVIGQVTKQIVDSRLRAERERFYAKALTLERLIAIDKDGSGAISGAEFLIYMLEKTRLVDKDDLDKIHKTFQHFDKTGDGEISIDDLKELVDRKGQLSQEGAALASPRGPGFFSQLSHSVGQLAQGTMARTGMMARGGPRELSGSPPA
ncbi:unnamed protein product [Vitrella brassicaformis CCMP3155]|uniref:EF-hand domain-containing protein n=2 Tax=Vitrella brassicaformis TaxID=1169539 RepID=A0A0G4FSQ3_VITBC|nr:unnamed protein product [Vitrella brassicaformis CCMP3155]|eukprot:CEM17743.1 unnamed protein product [Vitrella brassicaformis CCMP3155]